MDTADVDLIERRVKSLNRALDAIARKHGEHTTVYASVDRRHCDDGTLIKISGGWIVIPTAGEKT